MTGTAIVCAKCGQSSTDAEFCSECGASLTNTAGAVAADPTNCPVCGEVRPGPHARYCDTCRYDFLERQPFSAAPTPVSPRWNLHAIVDLTLRREDDPMPADRHELIFPLDLPEQLIGRRSDSEAIRPEIVIADPGISRRHATILRAPDGVLSVIDLGSMNGTRLNTIRLKATTPTRFNPGDELTLGCWTRLQLRAR